MRTWMRDMRLARGEDISAAARACDVSVGLIYHIETSDWETLPEIAARIGAAYGMDDKQIHAITCPATIARREREKHKTPDEIQRDRLREVYGA